LTYERALELARVRSPAAVVARARAHEARSEVEAASVWRFNPQLSGGAGPRFGAAGQTTAEGFAAVQQWLELGGQRGLRTRAAEIGVDAEVARSEDAARLALRDVGVSFVAALYWRRRLDLAEENLRIAEAVARVASRRHELGDVGGLERSVSALAVVRARAEADRATAALSREQGRLGALLGLSPETDLILQGDLRRLGEIDGAAVDVEARPDLRALTAEIERAEAEAELGRASRVPNVAVGARYVHEESEDLVRGTLAIELPAFDHGQGAAATAEAKRARLEVELETRRDRARVEARTARAVADELSRAARRFERDGLETLERAERLTTTSYEAGAIPLGELLAVRRELVLAKLDYTDLLLGAAAARVELAASAGAL